MRLAKLTRPQQVVELGSVVTQVPSPLSLRQRRGQGWGDFSNVQKSTYRTMRCIGSNYARAEDRKFHSRGPSNRVQLRVQAC